MAVLDVLRMLRTDEVTRTVQVVRAGGDALVQHMIGGRTFDAGDQLLLDGAYHAVLLMLLKAGQTEVQRTLELVLFLVDDLVRVVLVLKAFQVVEFAWRTGERAERVSDTGTANRFERLEGAKVWRSRQEYRIFLPHFFSQHLITSLVSSLQTKHRCLPVEARRRRGD